MKMYQGGVAQMLEISFYTRLHVRYDNLHFPSDLEFHVTSNMTSHQGRYVMNHMYDGPID